MSFFPLHEAVNPHSICIYCKSLPDLQHCSSGEVGASPILHRSFSIVTSSKKIPLPGVMPSSKRRSFSKISSLGAWDDMSIKDGEDHGEKDIFFQKEPIVNFQKGSKCEKSCRHRCRDLCLSLPVVKSGLGNIYSVLLANLRVQILRRRAS